jgi:gamma-glutamylaminecyclotransferase
MPLFVLGTLKRGFPYHHHLDGATFLGRFRTCEPYPLVIAGPWYAPMMFDQPGIGEIIDGELYQLDGSILARIDWLESIGSPGNFRIELRVRPDNGDTEQIAMAYVKSPELARPVHSGYLADYQDRRFIPHDKRQAPTGTPEDR